MGLLDFLKRKGGSSQPGDAERRDNFYVLDGIIARLRAMGMRAVKDKQYCSVLVNDELLISTVISRRPEDHPNVFNLIVNIASERWFPGRGIFEQIASIGADFEQQVALAIDNLFHMLLETLFRSLTDVHNADDLVMHTGSREVRLHTYLGKVYVTGQPETDLGPHTMYDRLSDPIRDLLIDRKFNWVKLYIGKMYTGELYHDCIVNNQPTPGAEPVLQSLAASLEGRGDLLSVRQWIFFRRCDEFEDEPRPTSEQALRAVSCFTKGAESAAAVVSELQQVFPERHTALQYFYFIPLLFGRFKGGFDHVLFAAKYRVRETGGRYRTFYLASNPVYRILRDTIRVQLMNISDRHLEGILRYSGEYRFLKDAVKDDDQLVEGVKFDLDFTRVDEVEHHFLFHDRSKAEPGEIADMMLTDFVTHRNLSASKSELAVRGFSETFIDFMEAMVMDTIAKADESQS